MRKFAKKNRAALTTAAAIALLLVAGIAVSTWQAVRATRARRRTGRARREAERAEGERRPATQGEGKAGRDNAPAEKARDRTREVLDAMTSSVTGDSLTTQKEISAEQKKFLTEVLTYYQEFAGEKADDEQTRARTANAAFRVGQIEYRLGRKEEGTRRFNWLGTAIGTLAADFPAVPAYRQELAHSHNNLGILLADLGKRPEAEEQYRKALAIQEKLAADFPAVPEYRQDLARSHNNLGILLADLGKRPEAEEQYRKALAIQEKLAADFPAVPAYRQDLAISHNNLGILLAGSGEAAGGGGAVPPGPGHPREAGRRLPRRAGRTARTWPPATTTWGFCWPAWGSGRRRRSSTARPWRSRRSWPPTSPPCLTIGGHWL